MSPFLFVDDPPDVISTNTIFQSQTGVGVPGAFSGADRSDVILCQAGTSMCHATARTTAPLPNSIFTIIGPSAQEKVLRVTAHTYITSMKNTQILRDWSVNQNPGSSMGSPLDLFAVLLDVRNSVSRPDGLATPEPAGVFSSRDVDFRPETSLSYHGIYFSTGGV